MRDLYLRDNFHFFVLFCFVLFWDYSNKVPKQDENLLIVGKDGKIKMKETNLLTI